MTEKRRLALFAALAMPPYCSLYYSRCRPSDRDQATGIGRRRVRGTRSAVKKDPASGGEHDKESASFREARRIRKR